MNTGIRASDYRQIAELAGKIPNPERFSKADLESLKQSSEDFEALFLEIMLKSMRDSVPKSKLIDGGNGEEIFRGMLDSEHAKTMASQRLSGIAEAIERQLLELGKAPNQEILKTQGIEKYRR